MNLNISFLGLLFFISFIADFDGKNAAIETIEIPFYSEKLAVVYHPDITIVPSGMLEEQKIVAFYQQLEESSYEVFVESLLDLKNRLQLNDWLLYELTEKSVKGLMPHQSDKHQTLITWFLLSKLGYDTRLAFLKNDAFLYVRTEENIYETPLIEDNGQRFAGLTEMQISNSKAGRSVYLLNFLAMPNGRPFSFSLARLPQLKSVKQEKIYRFDWEETSFSLPVAYDKTLVDIMKNYPVVGETDYLIVPFSRVLKESLLPSLRYIIKGKTIQESLQILTVFTRSAFQYREDEDFFGRNKPMIRDEVFFYPYSDCEDRSAVFFGLVEELLDLPMIIVAFPDHLTVAVALDEPIGSSSIAYKGKRFYICDPTGPSNSDEIGRIPRGYEKQTFEILMDSL